MTEDHHARAPPCERRHKRDPHWIARVDIPPRVENTIFPRPSPGEGTRLGSLTNLRPRSRTKPTFPPRRSPDLLPDLEPPPEPAVGIITVETRPPGPLLSGGGLGAGKFS